MDFEKNPFKMRFHASALEDDYLDYYYQVSIVRTRIALLVALVAYTLFALLDRFAAPDALNLIRMIRLYVGIPSLALTILLSFTPVFKGYYQQALLVVSLIMALSMTYTAVITGAGSVHTYYAGLVLVLMFIYTFIGLRFIQATLAGWLLVMMYEGFLIFLHSPSLDSQLHHNLLLVVANAIGMWIGYHFEYHSRKNFLDTWTYQNYMDKKDQVLKDLSHENDDLKSHLHHTGTELSKSKKTMIDHEFYANVGKVTTLALQDMQKPLRYAKSDLVLLKEHYSTITPVVQKYFESSPDYSDLLKLSKECMGLITSLDKELASVTRTVTDLTDFSNAVNHNYHHFDINQTLLTTLSLTKGNIKPYADVKLVLCNEADIYGNIQSIHQVFYQIIRNATDAIKARSQDQKGHIQVSTFNEDKHIRIDVCDNGVGMTDEELASAFTPFYSTKQSKEASGLGLSFVYDVVKRHHGGDIHIQSIQSQGTTVSLRIPKTPTVFTKQAKLSFEKSSKI